MSSIAETQVHSPSLIRQIADAALVSLRQWSQRRAAAIADAQLLQRATHDPRLLAELQTAVTRHESKTHQACPESLAIQKALIASRAARLPAALLLRKL